MFTSGHVNKRQRYITQERKQNIIKTDSEFRKKERLEVQNDFPSSSVKLDFKRKWKKINK